MIRLIGILIIAMGCITCSQNPVTGKKDFMLMSENQEINLGKQSDPDIIRAYGLYENAKMQNFIDSKGQEMARISHRNQLNYEFKIVDSPIVNAFAVPGGYVYFTRGIMAHFNNEAEFAGVLGHEIGHITARHSAKQYSKGMVAQLGLMLGMVFSSDFRRYSDLAQTGVSLLFLKFGRDAESQSDKLGVEYSTRIGYDAHEMAGFFSTIGRLQQQSGASVPTFLSTHPDPSDRFNKVNHMASEVQKRQPNKKYKVNRDSYLRMIDGLIYGEDPKQGFVENNSFYHPELKFQFKIPNGWKTANSPSQVQMVEPSQKAMLVMTLSGQANLDAAVQEAAENYQLEITHTQNTTVNGLQARAVMGKNAELQAQMYFIKYGQYVYLLTGVATLEDFNTYRSILLNAQKSFAKLTDPSKLNRKPDRIKIVSAPTSGTATSVFQALRIPANKHQEHAVLNGMELNENITSGTLLKKIAEG